MNANPNLFERLGRNPILTAKDWPYPCHSVFNPGATLLQDGSTLLLCRVEDRRGISHLCAARSANGLDGWEIDREPTLSPDPEHYPEELWGIEDPRITYCAERELYLVAFTAFGRSGPGVAVATTTDFKTFERKRIAMQPNDKDAAFFPKLINGDYCLIHRPVTDAEANMWISYSPDLVNWGGHKLLLPARRGAWWDAYKIGLSSQPIETERGWLVIYHGVRVHASGSIYRLGLALFDLDDPSKCLLRSQQWVFGPEMPYELVGDVGSAVFPCGITVLPDGDRFRMYYGAADSCICVAESSISKLLEWLDKDGSTLVGTAGQQAEISTIPRS